ncbi:MAG: hypothetical protein JOZ70_09560 [Pseudolabrys sp.]|nr:hypothetical protein [Pseudolabrys sp.]
MAMITKNAPEREEIEHLLPWHAAGTLSHRDAKRVEDALAADPDLARQYALVREELGETIILNEKLGAPSARAMETLFRKIDAEPVRKPAVSLNLADRLGAFLSGLAPRKLALAGGIAAIALILQAGIIAGILLNETAPGGYQTASAPSRAPIGGSFAMIRFADKAPAADITAFLDSNKLTVVGGPLAGGLYRVRIAATALPKDDVARMIKLLQQDKTVEFIATTD